ncbi:hypothetical protein Bca52824_077115 [Brassica carinata]|uniref:Uncharacterized protein n=1 Tax=Brassica carinata TaxID=52824 RepID=A0A8X7TY93_BRACI|nr:hypothetical protein Bca52824_077115 [Brassica carinata]
MWEEWSLNVVEEWRIGTGLRVRNPHGRRRRRLGEMGRYNTMINTALLTVVLSSDFNPSLTSLISAVLASLLLRGRFDLVSERRDVGGVEFECGGGVANWNRLEVIAHRGCGGTIHISRETRGN